MVCQLSWATSKCPCILRRACGMPLGLSTHSTFTSTRHPLTNLVDVPRNSTGRENEGVFAQCMRQNISHVPDIELLILNKLKTAVFCHNELRAEQ